MKRMLAAFGSPGAGTVGLLANSPLTAKRRFGFHWYGAGREDLGLRPLAVTVKLTKPRASFYRR
jgi:hypothetical protein